MMRMMLLCLAALLVDAALGYPKELFDRVGHPVCWMGAILSWLEALFNRPQFSKKLRRATGFACLIVYLAAIGLAAEALNLAVEQLPISLSLVAGGVLASSLVAQRSLFSHVSDVQKALAQGDIESARSAVSRIVGRDTAALGEASIIRAALESLAENFSDGIVAPALYLASFGLVGGALYKAANTADSMIGHRSAQFLEFGCASARFDDFLNFLPARTSGLLIVMASLMTPNACPRTAWRIMLRDSRGHASPNAGWPEAAMAGALRTQLGGPRLYAGVLTSDTPIGDDERSASIAVLRDALTLYRRSCGMLALLIILMLTLTFSVGR